MSSFKYTSLKDGEIRIIELRPGDGIDRIQGSIKANSVKGPNPERYSALSYTWGPESQPRSTIFLDDQQFEVRQNLFEALQQLRYRDRCRLWIDAICINQEDNEDKKMQIPLMSLIYSKAETVEIWLGTGEDNGELGLQSLASRELEAIATPEIVCAVIDLLQRPWFSRVWVIQELVLSGNDVAFVNCGSTRVTWDNFSLGVTEILNTLTLNGAFLRRLVPQKRQPEDSSAPSLSDIQVATLRNLLSTVMTSYGIGASMLCGLRSTYSNRVAESKPKPSSAVGVVLRHSRYAKATVSKDKVYGLCGLLGTFAVDELMKSFDKTADEVFFAATLHILRNDTHPNMYHEYPTIPSSRAKTSNVPSWTLDFSFSGITYAELRFTSFTKFNVPRQPQDKLTFRSSDSKELTVDVCIVDTITRVLDYATIARAPDTPNAWNAFSVRFCKAAGIDAKIPLDISWQDRSNVLSTVEAVNLITFLEKAHELHRQRTACTAYEDTNASFWVTLLSGLAIDYGKSTGNALPAGSQLAEHGEILLGRRDGGVVAPAVSPTVSRLAHFVALALDLPDPQIASVATTRRLLAPALYSGLQQVLAPRGCDAPSSFYVTDHGLYGLCLPGAQVGDVIVRLFRGTGFEIPAVLRPEGSKKYSMVCVASVSKAWEELCRARKVMDPEEVVLV